MREDASRRSAPADETGRDASRAGDPISGSHARADRDLALLARPELRPVRLQLEYLKPELAFRDHGIQNTIVVFGSARLEDPDLAGEGDENERGSAAGSAGEGALARGHYYRVGREFGRIVGECGDGPDDNRLVLVTGGGPGGMEAANRGAFEVGAASVGLNITLPLEQAPNAYLSPGLSFEFRYFALRKLHFMLRARALVALPGGYGTLDELFETLCLIQTGKRAPLPVVLIGEEFWSRGIDFDFLAEAGMIDPADVSLFSYAETAAEAWRAILDWYERRGLSLFDDGVGAADTEDDS